jgi:hypothetical protein
MERLPKPRRRGNTRGRAQPPGIASSPDEREDPSPRALTCWPGDDDDRETSGRRRRRAGARVGLPAGQVRLAAAGRASALVPQPADTRLTVTPGTEMNLVRAGTRTARLSARIGLPYT